ncbi:L,D-transpeptidase [Mycolicibacterium sp. 018/SC-01/001]|uniref:L,D-transpeptidase n=1 Tax=Mycolicibacterium sp. 018/SC-01/001 TaxID=2592069 RepID=UPI00117F1065|nr:L,D-transpeptidase [Mycolicibacterium sp. 018/SC-01/001]TRW82490.1 L,D-transpeptidase [Mycolicibacterium sp. 018/SC-01/001]
MAGLSVGPSAVGAVDTGLPALPSTISEMSPSPGETVGVGHPVTVTFTARVPDRGAVESSFAVRPADAAGPAAGTFSWLTDRTLQWTPAQFFPAHAPVDVSVGGFATSFRTGSSVVGVADLSAHTFTVSIDGVVAREMPASMGKPNHPTPIGNFTALEKQKSVVMDSRTIGIPLDDPEGYKLTVADAVRVTWGGVYVHSAPWSVGSQGYANVSHGCINLSPDNAAWYYDQVSVGDPIVVQA